MCAIERSENLEQMHIGWRAVIVHLVMRAESISSFCLFLSRFNYNGICCVVPDCPRNVTTEPADQSNLRAGQVLTCRAHSHPAPYYVWVDHVTGTTTYSQTLTLQPGRYHLTCIAINDASSQEKPVCGDPDTLASKYNETTNFPFNLFNSTRNFIAVFNTSCEANTSITGHAIGIFASWCWTVFTTCLFQLITAWLSYEEMSNRHVRHRHCTLYDEWKLRLFCS